MRRPSAFCRTALQQIVESMQSLFYLDLDDQDAEFWNPHKHRDAGDVCQWLEECLQSHELAPGQNCQSSQHHRIAAVASCYTTSTRTNCVRTSSIRGRLTRPKTPMCWTTR